MPAGSNFDEDRKKNRIDRKSEPPEEKRKCPENEVKQMKFKYTPESVAREAVRILQEKADPIRALGARKYFKEQVTFYGLTSDQVRKIAKELLEPVKKEWRLKEAIELCEILLPNRFFEARSVATLIFLKFEKEFGPDIFPLVKKWLARNLLDNWAAVDTLCPDCLGPLLDQYPELVEKIEGWTGHTNRWVKRASAVSFIKLARRGKRLDAVYRIAERLFPADDDLIEKATGWLLREAGKTDMERLEKFLLERGPAIPRTTLRYAIERFPLDKKKQLLTKTR
jgi:3-methyladenine DNA glycosylase AlkD